MKISELVVKEFDPNVRSKGYSFYIRKQFKLTEINANDVTSEVYGVHKYNVNLKLDSTQKVIKFECTCNHFKQGFNCPHIWASLLAVEKNAKAEDFSSKAFFFYDEKMKEESQIKESAAIQAKDIKNSQEPYWKRSLDKAKDTFQSKKVISEFRAPQNEFLKKGFYILDIPSSLSYRQLVLHFRIQERKYNGEFGLLKKSDLNQEKIPFFESHDEQEILWDLIGRVEKNYFSKSQSASFNEFLINPDQSESIIGRIAEINQLYRLKKSKTGMYIDFQQGDVATYPLINETWYLDLHLFEFDKEDYKLTASLKNDRNEIKDIKEVIGYLDKYIFFEDSMAYFDSQKYGMWYEALNLKPMIISKDEAYDFLNTYWLNYTNTPNIYLPPELKFEEISHIFPKCKVILHVTEESTSQIAEVQFLYENYQVDGNYQEYILDLNKKIRIKRHHDKEIHFLNEFFNISPNKKSGFRSEFRFFNSQLTEVIEKINAHDWEIFLNKSQLKKAKDLQIKVSHQVDWLDLKVDLKIGETSVEWTQILTALKNNSNLVQLSDGTKGYLTQEIINKIKPYFEVGALQGDGIRLNRIQTLFLKSYIEQDFVIPSDNKLEQILKDLSELKPVKLSNQFKGELRDYQKKGVSWLTTLSENSLGGILADDMGLGKTIQMLAVLSQPFKKVASLEKKISDKKIVVKEDDVEIEQKVEKTKVLNLVVAPKSLVFNWKNEIEKFAPNLKVFTYFGPDRKDELKNIKKYDVMLTTYHTLRNDIDVLKDLNFYHFILDEAQNIKNPKSQVTVSTKLVQATKRFALTGTPIENSIGDLISILSVVTPGLITESLGQKFMRLSENEDLRRVSKALAPFILRRTKDQVLKDLPQKTEQILYCELSDEERVKYDEVRNFYWQKLNPRIKDGGVNHSKIEILGALLRLRQICCHVGLVEKNKDVASSAKLDLLIEQLQTIIKEGHKALVFSSFTSLLKLLTQQLHQKGISFEYLDGQTKDREERVNNFQTNADVPLFLLSLKAGGVGLNLTAADYVFIIDPWWNPAAESQAIDRCYRIGQTKKVFAYKLIAKNTVEEKILKLQERKKNLANQIISSDASILKELSVDDLADLFS
ncbi:MAG: DEAD/DEAH box helicase [Bdellovibrionaceae bacterium]|nr:DEAD/DEAH box helicase [Pseudobdellovibrionaceae bacterium]